MVDFALWQFVRTASIGKETTVQSSLRELFSVGGRRERVVVEMERRLEGLENTVAGLEGVRLRIQPEREAAGKAG